MPRKSSRAAASAASPAAAASTWPASRRTRASWPDRAPAATSATAAAVVTGSDRPRRRQQPEPEVRGDERDRDQGAGRDQLEPLPRVAGGGVAHAAITPSRSRTVRLAPAATSGLWVTMRMLWPAAWSRRNSVEHLGGAVAVERAGRLVGEQQGRRVGERAGDRQPLPLAAGQGRRRGPRLVEQAEQVEQLLRAALGGAAARRRRPGAASTTFSSTVMPSSRWKNWKTMPTSLRRTFDRRGLGQRGELLAGQLDRALVRPVQAGGDVQQRRLAAARRAHQRDELAAARPPGRRRAARAPVRSRPRRYAGPPIEGRAPAGPARASSTTAGRSLQGDDPGGRRRRAVLGRSRQVPPPPGWW